MVTICISPGHGKNTGCRAGAIIEDEYVLRICEMVARKCCDENLNINMIPTRCLNDENPTHEERARIAKAHDADLAILVHVNKTADTREHGPLAFRLLCVPHSQDVADEIIKSIGRKGEYVETGTGELRPMKTQVAICRPIDGHWTSRALVCLQPFGDMPAVLIECEYCSNPEAYVWLLSNEGKEQLVKSIVSGIKLFLKLRGDEDAARI